MDLEAKAREMAATCACFKLRKASRAVSQRYDEALQSCELKITQVTLLTALVIAGPIPVGMLAQILVLDRTTLTRNIELLIRDGMAETVQGKDKRVKLLKITAKGRKALAKAIPLWEQAQSEIMNKVGENGWKELDESLNHVTSIALKR